MFRQGKGYYCKNVLAALMIALIKRKQFYNPIFQTETMFSFLCISPSVMCKYIFYLIVMVWLLSLPNTVSQFPHAPKHYFNVCKRFYWVHMPDGLYCHNYHYHGANIAGFSYMKLPTSPLFSSCVFQHDSSPSTPRFQPRRTATLLTWLPPNSGQR